MSEELDEIQAIFFEECAEGLATAEAGLSAMAAGDVSASVIAGVFRAVHSIKGGSGAFGHTALTAFSHIFENVLDEVRADRIPATPEVTKVMLAAFDVLSDHVASAQGTAPLPNDAAALAALEGVLATKGVAAPAPAPVPEADEFGFTPVTAEVEEFDPFGFEPVGVILEDLESPEPAAWTVRFRPSREALANASEPLLVIRELEGLGGEVTSVDSSALPGLRDLDPEDGYLTWTLQLPGTVEESAISEAFDFVAPDSLIAIERASEAATLRSVAEPPEGNAPFGQAEPSPVVVPIHGRPEPVAEVAIAATPEGRTVERATEPATQTIRVDLTKLDLLLNLVGELVIRNSILSDRLSPKDQERVELPELARLTREIQDNVMSLRAQPIKQAFSRVPRMLRDLSAETGKQYLLETSGEATEVDKGVIEKIGDPLTHMIRNACDHGIESAEERIARGKPAAGTIRLSAEQRGARIFVRVADDGRGIDRQRVLAKAIDKGIVSADASLSNEEIDQLICAPGFSTAETISNISGRGVGMDVVRSNVEALGGRVEISSVPGEGTTFTMILPLTLAILDGMIVRLADQRFVLPLANVVEAVRPESGQVRRMSPTSEVIELRGNYLPVRRLTDTFGFGSKYRRDPEESLVIIVESESAGNVGLMVDTIDDRREVVIKSLDQNLHPIRGLGGATILGDGSIALILDIEALVASPASTAKFALKGLAA
ncbi:chemotaxis protein CheA [Sphingomonas sp. IC-11]|uniref:chemotaxis protein CheA n=1 Tax=Sphingomonas sp. IC-11 TaxID=2898528 RepID=UPI001E337085|nr:chemotaxis protein CheA [Sphingomonas sp. IC-11]